MPSESEPDAYFTRSQIAIVREAEALILNDLSKRVTARGMRLKKNISKNQSDNVLFLSVESDVSDRLKVGGKK